MIAVSVDVQRSVTVSILAIALIGCEANQPPLRLSTVSPDLAAFDRTTTITLEGSFYAPLSLDLRSGRVTARDGFEVEVGGEPLDEVNLISDEALEAVVPAGFRLGLHDLLVRDALGREAELSQALEVIPGDTNSPQVVITGPEEGAHFLPGGSFMVLFSVVDEPPGLVREVIWHLDGAVTDASERVLSEPSREYYGAFTVEIPAEPESRELFISIEAVDDAPSPNRGQAQREVWVDLCRHDEECDDGLFCNGSERCLDGGCAAGAPPLCDDGVECTADECDEAASACVNLPDDDRCSDDRFCNGAEWCDLVEGCLAGPPPCDDGIECTFDYCEEDPVIEGEGQCYSVADDERCDDGLFCTGEEMCHPEYGCLVTVQPCEDSYECTIDSCNEEEDFCEIIVDDSRCDDGDECTVDWCDKDKGCQTVQGVEGPAGDPSCMDELDNDCDGSTDLADPDCL